MKKLLVIFLVLFATPALAKERTSFAAAIAPEQAFETCRAADVPKAVACALDKCEKAGGQDCIISSACTMGWAGLLGVSTGETHWTESVCGAPSEDAVLAALRVFCKGHLPYVQECYLSVIWSPSGEEKKVEQSLDPKTIE